MRQKNFFSFLRRLYDGQANFQSRHSPRAGVANRFVEHHRIVEFHQLPAPGWSATPEQGHVLGPLVAVNEQAILRLAEIAFFASRDKYTEVIGYPRLNFAAVADLSFLRATDAHLIFVGIFIARAIQQRFADRRSLGFRVAAVLPAPGHE